MPDYKSHKARYNHNKQFLSTIDENAYSDWAITICFYCSLHKICQCLKYVYNATDDETNSHRKTLDYLANKNFSLYQKYTILYGFSRESRYQCIDVSAKLIHAKTLLTQIENAANQLISQHTLQLLK